MTKPKTSAAKKRPNSNSLTSLKTAFFAGSMVVTIIGGRALDWQAASATEADVVEIDTANGTALTDIAPALEPHVIEPLPQFKAIALNSDVRPAPPQVTQISTEIADIPFAPPATRSIQVAPLTDLYTSNRSASTATTEIEQTTQTEQVNVVPIEISSAEFTPQAQAIPTLVAPPSPPELQLDLAPVTKAYVPPPIEIKPPPPPPSRSNSSSSPKRSSRSSR